MSVERGELNCAMKSAFTVKPEAEGVAVFRCKFSAPFQQHMCKSAFLSALSSRIVSVSYLSGWLSCGG